MSKKYHTSAVLSTGYLYHICITPFRSGSSIFKGRDARAYEVLSGYFFLVHPPILPSRYPSLMLRLLQKLANEKKTFGHLRR